MAGQAGPARSSPEQDARGRRTRDLLDPPGCVDSQNHIPTVTVVDPRHPLYRHTFQVVARHRTSREPLSFEVEHRDGIILRIAAAATDRAHCPPSSPRSKITPVVLRQLLGLLADWKEPCVSRPVPSGDDSRRTVRRPISEQVTMIYQEVLHDHIRTHPAVPISNGRPSSTPANPVPNKCSIIKKAVGFSSRSPSALAPSVGRLATSRSSTPTWG